jgi:hypothetical protein
MGLATDAERERLGLTGLTSVSGSFLDPNLNLDLDLGSSLTSGSGSGSGVGSGAGSGSDSIAFAGNPTGSISQALGIKAIGSSQVALRTTPSPWSKPTMVFQDHATKPPEPIDQYWGLVQYAIHLPIYPIAGMMPRIKDTTRPTCGPSAAAGIWSMIHCNAVVTIAARLAASSF